MSENQLTRREVGQGGGGAGCAVEEGLKVRGTNVYERGKKVSKVSHPRHRDGTAANGRWRISTRVRPGKLVDSLHVLATTIFEA